MHHMNSVMLDKLGNLSTCACRGLPMHHMNAVTLDKLGNLSTCACRGLKFRRIYTYQKKKKKIRRIYRLRV